MERSSSPSDSLLPRLSSSHWRRALSSASHGPGPHYARRLLLSLLTASLRFSESNSQPDGGWSRQSAMENPSNLLDGLAYGFAVTTAPGNLLACFAGVLVGTLVGVLPGIGTVGAMALLFPLSYNLSAAGAIIMLAGIYYGAMYGGSTTSILMNIPGEAASVVTCIDGHQMARRGQAGAALGIAAFGSFIAGTAGVVGITLLAPPLASFALRFGPPEIFCLLVLGLSMITGIAGESRLKSLLMVLAGLLLSC